jgi:hypothetical protein
VHVDLAKGEVRADRTGRQLDLGAELAILFVLVGVDPAARHHRVAFAQRGRHMLGELAEALDLHEEAVARHPGTELLVELPLVHRDSEDRHRLAVAGQTGVDVRAESADQGHLGLVPRHGRSLLCPRRVRS